MQIYMAYEPGFTRRLRRKGTRRCYRSCGIRAALEMLAALSTVNSSSAFARTPTAGFSFIWGSCCPCFSGSRVWPWTLHSGMRKNVRCRPLRTPRRRRRRQWSRSKLHLNQLKRRFPKFGFLVRFRRSCRARQRRNSLFRPPDGPPPRPGLVSTRGR